MNNPNKRNKQLPCFLVIGAQKSGTTSLHDILRQHSKVYLPPEKEVHFFDNEKKYAKGLNYYSSFFIDANDNQLIGEVAPEYFWRHYVAERIFKDLGGKTKLIVILRNPANRAYSHYKMNITKGLTKDSVSNIVNKELKRIRNKSNSHVGGGCISRGFYARQIKAYLKYFPLTQMHFILFEDEFLKNREKTINDIFGFLNLENENIHINIKSYITAKPKSKSFDDILNTPNLINQIAKKLIPSKKYRVMLKAKLKGINTDKSSFPDEEFESLKSMLIKDAYYDDIKELEKIINRDLSSWYKDIPMNNNQI